MKNPFFTWFWVKMRFILRGPIFQNLFSFRIVINNKPLVVHRGNVERFC
jgi:hypothetical protein